MEDSLEQKQKYLRINILEKGYDPNDFVLFLEKNQNIDHVDIQGWSMKQIQHLVGIYQQYKLYTQQQQKGKNEQTALTQKQKKLHQERLQQAKKLLPKEQINFYQENKTKIEYPRYAPLFDYEFSGIFKCIKAENLIKNKSLEVTVPKFELVESAGIFLGLGAKTEVWFTLKTNIQPGPVKRLLQDLDWFSFNLARLYPILALPQLPEHKKDGQFANERRRVQAQQYFQHLAKRPFLLKSNFFIDFLTVSSDKIEKLKKSYESMGFAKGVSLLKTDTGQIDVTLSKKNRSFQQDCYQYSKKVTQIHQNLQMTIQKTIDSFTQVVDNINRIVDYFADLHQNYNGLMNKYPQQKNRDYNQMLININNLFHGISDNLRSHSNNIEKHIKQYFKFNVLSDKNVTKLEKYIKEQEKLYLQFKYNLARKKQRLFNEPQKWEIDLKLIDYQEVKQHKQKAYEIMLPRQTVQQNQIKAWVGFLYSNFQKQFKVYIEDSTIRYAEKFKLLATDLLSKDKNYLESLTKFIHQSRKFTGN